MKDFYLRLGIDHNVSATTIATALEGKPEMRVFAPILLREEKRAVYDRTHAALRAIGVLRHRLQLDSGDSWFLENCPDFVPRLRSGVASARPVQAKTEVSRPEDSDSVPRHQSEKSRRPARFKWLGPVLIGIIVIILLSLIFPFF